jgi:hypothetical protein
MTTLRDVLENMESVPPEPRHPELDHGFLGSIPARTSPVNASLTPSRAPAHDSGPAWLATPSPYDSLIHCTAAV